MENARLHDRIAALAVVEERERIGRDLHDGIIQRLYAVSLSLEDVGELATEDPGEVESRIDRAIESLQTTIGDIRHFILGLRPGLLTSSDSPGASIGWRRRSASPPSSRSRRTSTRRATELDDEGATQLLGLAREALSNVEPALGARPRPAVGLSVEERMRARGRGRRGRLEPSGPTDQITRG